MYIITQKLTIKRKYKLTKLFFGDLKINKVYTFESYKEALIFALSEQIKFIECIISPSIKPTKRIPYLIYMNSKEFIKAAKINPLHFIGSNSYKNVDLEHYYFYLVASGNLHKLKKYI